MVHHAVVEIVERTHLTRVIPKDLKLGFVYQADVVIQEGDKKRVQSYRGTLIRHHVAGLKSTVTLRKLSAGIGVERVFPVVSPDIRAFNMVESRPKSKRRRRL